MLTAKGLSKMGLKSTLKSLPIDLGVELDSFCRMSPAMKRFVEQRANQQTLIWKL